MNSKTISTQILIITVAYLLVGCYAIGVYPRSTVKSVADALEVFPIGTPLSQMTQDPRMGKLNFQKPVAAGYRPIIELGINPSDKELRSFSLYRQYPRGILLNIIQDDLHGEILVSEKNTQNGVVDVFYDKDYHFKGYFAYSHVRYSDDGDRLRMEKESFHNLGLEDLARRCWQWGFLVGAGPEKEKTIPNLPLSQYIRPDNSK